MEQKGTMKEYNGNTHITFLGKKLRLNSQDRFDPNVMLMLSQIELTHLQNGNGIVWYRYLKNNYGLSLHSNLDLQIENILVSTNETYESFLGRNKG